MSGSPSGKTVGGERGKVPTAFQRNLQYVLMYWINEDRSQRDQSAFAELLHISPGWLSRLLYSSAEPNMQTVMRVCDLEALRGRQIEPQHLFDDHAVFQQRFLGMILPDKLPIPETLRRGWPGMPLLYERIVAASATSTFILYFFSPGHQQVCASKMRFGDMTAGGIIAHFSAGTEPEDEYAGYLYALFDYSYLVLSPKTPLNKDVVFAIIHIPDSLRIEGARGHLISTQDQTATPDRHHIFGSRLIMLPSEQNGAQEIGLMARESLPRVVRAFFEEKELADCK